jgi:hypothetical protein
MPTQKRAGRATKKGRAGRARKRGRAERATERGGSARGSRRGGQRTRRRSAGGSSRSAPSNVKYSKWIDSPDDHEDRNGQSLATRNHDVIRQWAESRNAMPAVVGDTEGRGAAGVLRIDFEGYGGKRLRKVDWNDWFDTFDKRKLVFLYQEHKRDGSTSTFFKLAA